MGIGRNGGGVEPTGPGRLKRRLTMVSVLNRSISNSRATQLRPRSLDAPFTHIYAMAAPDLLKQLEVKKRVVARTMKDLQLYRQEELDERAKVDKLKANSADPYDIKYAESILQEAVAMVPDAVQRLRAAHCDLKSFLDSNAAEISSDQLTESTNLIQNAVTMVDA